MNPFQKHELQKLAPRPERKVPANFFVTRGKVRGQVVNCLLDSPEPLTSRQVVDQTGLTYRQVINAIQALVATNRIHVATPGKRRPTYEVKFPQEQP